MHYRMKHMIYGFALGLCMSCLLYFSMGVCFPESEQKNKAQVRVLCWIMTGPENLDKKAVHVKNTWGKRCDILLFMSSVKNDSFPTVGLNTTEGRDHLLAKTILAFRYIYEHYFDSADWFLKADDDTYIIMENLRHFLSSKNTETPIFFGRQLIDPLLKEYFTGGGGYVLSKAALRRFGEAGGDSSLCRQDGPSEDIHFSKCMENLGVVAGDSTDSLGRNRFHQLKLNTHITKQYPKWFFKRNPKNVKTGLSSVSEEAISFHYIMPEMMYELEFYLYSLRLSIYSNSHS